MRDGGRLAAQVVIVLVVAVPVAFVAYTGFVLWDAGHAPDGCSVGLDVVTDGRPAYNLTRADVDALPTPIREGVLSGRPVAAMNLDVEACNAVSAVSTKASHRPWTWNGTVLQPSMEVP